MNSIQFTPVTTQMLKEIVEKITAIGTPLKIVLFGSWARGEAHAESDLDLLIIEEPDQGAGDVRARAPYYHVALAGIDIPKDIVVRTPTEVYEWSAVPNAFITTALREGKLLYEKSV